MPTTSAADLRDAAADIRTMSVLIWSSVMAIYLPDPIDNVNALSLFCEYQNGV